MRVMDECRKSENVQIKRTLKTLSLLRVVKKFFIDK